MTDREIVKHIIKNDGYCEFIKSRECPLYRYGCCLSDTGSLKRAKQWLKDHSEEKSCETCKNCMDGMICKVRRAQEHCKNYSRWQPKEKDDWIYLENMTVKEIQELCLPNYEIQAFLDEWINVEETCKDLIMNIANGEKYRIRKKKDLAQEYVDAIIYPTIIHYHKPDELKQLIKDAINWTIDKLQEERR